MTLAQGYVRCAHCSAVVHVVDSRLVETEPVAVRLCRECWFDKCDYEHDRARDA